MSPSLPLIVTPGEPAGIGAEITIKSWHAGQRDICVIESPTRLADIAATLGTPLAIHTITHPDQFISSDQALNVIPIDWSVPPVSDHQTIAMEKWLSIQSPLPWGFAVVGSPPAW